MGTEMCVLPVQCERCRAIFDLWYDLQQQSTLNGGLPLSQQKIGEIRLESLCWFCRKLAAEEAKFREYEQYEKNDLTNNITEDSDFELDFE